jgi:broad specificity phosphatase PhoE
MKKVYFVRHGESKHNQLGIYAGTIDSPLTKLGFLQAQKTAELLKDKDIRSIISSNLQRAKNTSSEILKKIDLSGKIHLEITPLLNEICIGNMQGEKYRNISGISYIAKNNTGDSINDVYHRAVSFVRYIHSNQRDGNLLIVGHESFISVIFAVLERKELDELVEYCNKWSLKNGDIRIKLLSDFEI